MHSSGNNNFSGQHSLEKLYVRTWTSVTHMNRMVVNRRRRRRRRQQVAAVLALRVPERVVPHHLSDGGQVLGPAAGDDAGHADDRLVMVFRLDPDHRGLE